MYFVKDTVLNYCQKNNLTWVDRPFDKSETIPYLEDALYKNIKFNGMHDALMSFKEAHKVFIEQGTVIHTSTCITTYHGILLKMSAHNTLCQQLSNSSAIL